MIEKEDTVSLTVYFPKSVYKCLKNRVKITERSLTKEVIYLIKLGLSYGSEADVRALSQLIQHLPKETE
jgi:hypothetical protein